MQSANTAWWREKSKDEEWRIKCRGSNKDDGRSGCDKAVDREKCITISKIAVPLKVYTARGQCVDGGF